MSSIKVRLFTIMVTCALLFSVAGTQSASAQYTPTKQILIHCTHKSGEMVEIRIAGTNQDGQLATRVQQTDAYNNVHTTGWWWWGPPGVNLLIRFNGGSWKNAGPHALSGSAVWPVGYPWNAWGTINICRY